MINNLGLIEDVKLNGGFHAMRMGSTLDRLGLIEINVHITSLSEYRH
jgi:hypothetical protein